MSLLLGPKRVERPAAGMMTARAVEGGMVGMVNPALRAGAKRDGQLEGEWGVEASRPKIIRPAEVWTALVTMSSTF